MKYNSTRNKNTVVTAAQAISQGISEEGGLFVPQELPKYSADELLALSKLDYKGRAKKILADFLSDFTAEEISESVDAAYAAEKFGGDNPAPISYLHNGDENMYILELWHGPTSAFKDMALQILPHLLTKSMHKVHDGKEAVILVATSGDTGKAALEGFKDVDGTKIMVFYPVDGVSPMQKRQMTTQKGSNVNVFAIKGNFDDAQTGVKKMFSNKELAKVMNDNGFQFSSANSINIGRLVPQVVYYVKAYADLLKQGALKAGEPMNVVVPTGNFGNILASYYAKQMGIPIGKFVCASNKNKVLFDFFETGKYDRNREFYVTTSPSMDILISSNLERMIYRIAGNDAKQCAKFMAALTKDGEYVITDAMKAELSEFFGAFGSEEETAVKIKEVYDKEGYVMDTHTAVAAVAYDKYKAATGDDKTPTVIASTASPYKFTRSVMDAIDPAYDAEDDFELVDELNKVSKTAIPKAIEEIRTAPVLHDTVCETAAMEDEVKKILGI